MHFKLTISATMLAIGFALIGQPALADASNYDGTLPRPRPMQPVANTAAKAVDPAAPRPASKPLPSPVSASVAPAAKVDRTVPAKKLFGRKKTPANLRPRVYGGYTRGCLAGGKSLAINGDAWQVMRLSRNRNWGHPELIDFLERLGKAAPGLGWRGLLVGDLAQPRGGPMLTGHRSHQLGLDADIWLKPMPAKTMSRKERENVSAVSMLIKGTRKLNKKIWTTSRHRLIRQAAFDRRVARIFVHPAIKKALCDGAGTNRSWLRKVRPWKGHHYHFHVRLSCPPGNSACKNQKPPPSGDGCGKELSWWLSDAPWKKAKKLKKPKKKKKKNKKPRKPRYVTMAQLPAACEQVLLAR